MKRPDVTPAQIIAVVQALVALAVAFGLHLNHEQRDAIVRLAEILAVALPLSDAHIRNGRARGQK